MTKKKSITYYIKSIFSRWTHNRKKKSFSNARTLLVRVAPIEFEPLSGLPACLAVPFRPSPLVRNLCRGRVFPPGWWLERVIDEAQLTFRHWPHLIFTKFSESRMMLDTTLTLFSSESIIDRLSAAEMAIELLFKGTWFVRLEVSRCKGNGIWIECPCCSFWWSFWKVFFQARCVCATIFVREGEREREQKKKKRKLENLKIKRNSICRRLRIAKERKKNRVLSSNSFNINVSQCNLIFIRKKQKPKLHWYWINLSRDTSQTFAKTPISFFIFFDFRELDIAKKCDFFSASFALEACFNVGKNHIFLATLRHEIGRISHQRIKHDKLNWLIALYEWKSTTLGHFLRTF